MSGTKTPNGEQQVTPASQSQPTMKLCVSSQDGHKSYWKVRHDRPIKPLMMTYSDSKNMDYRAIRFIYDGKRIKPKQTADEIGLADGDEIDALYHQMGGAISRVK